MILALDTSVYATQDALTLADPQRASTDRMFVITVPIDQTCAACLNMDPPGPVITAGTLCARSTRGRYFMCANHVQSDPIGGGG